jgi:hypothetical protein
MFMTNHLIGFGVGSSNLTLHEAITAAGLTTNLETALDAGDNLSYTSGQSWLDRSGNGFDFFLGADGNATATDPTFNGTAGNISSSEYFSVDGGDLFRYDTTNETWMQNLHKNNAAFTLFAVVWIGTGSTAQGIFGNCRGSTGNVGVEFLVNTSDQLLFQCMKGGAPAARAATANGTALTTGAWHAIAISINEATGAGGGFFWADGSYAQVSSADTFDATYTTPSSSNATFTSEIGSRGDALQPLTANSRVAAFAAWEGTALSKANLDTLFALLRSRWSL